MSQKRSRQRYILIVRHGTKQELSNRFDLPICSKKYCQDKNTFSKLTTLKKSPNKKIVYCSPFLRTKQTAGRMAKKVDYTRPIHVVDGLGEAYTQVSRQLKKCGETKYRVASTSPKRLDKCMQNTSSTKEKVVLKKAMNELNKYKFSRKRGLKKSPKSKKAQDALFKRSVKKILKDNPNKDVIIVTHGRNVRASIQMLSPRRGIPRLSLPAPTCASVLYKEKSKKIKIENSKGIFVL
jgi:bisphosphoglycerate-dependent phosphoglycerate mutase